jgi:ketosteroid isomerase-like protein
MMTVKRVWIFLFFLCLVAGFALAADDSNLAARAAAWEKNYNAGNFDAVAAMYTSDGCRMPPHAQTVNGTAGIVGQLKTGSDQGGVKVKITVTMAETSGDMGVGSGTYQLMKADGSTLDQGKWMNVSKKTDGGWKIQCDIWNSNMPMPAPPAAK